MKLAKLSLAAILAAGALTTVASALPLEEAIKDVDVSGYGRYRYDTQRGKVSVNGETTKGETKAKHNFKSILTLKSTFDDRFFGAISLRYDSSDAGAKDGKNGDYKTDTTSTFGVQEIYLGYKAGNTTLLAGKQVLGTFFTDDMAGDGIKVLNSDITGLTLAAVAFDNLEADKDIGSTALAPTYENNLYGVAAIGSYDPVSFQVWAALLEDVAALYALDVNAAFDLGAAKLGVHGQFAYSSLDSDLKKNDGPVANGNFLGLETTLDVAGFDATLGFVKYGTKYGKFSVISYEDQGKFINPGEQSFQNFSAFQGKNKFFFVGAGYTVAEKVRFGLDYIKGTEKADEGDKAKIQEILVSANYKYSKKLNFKTWFSNLKVKEEGDKATNNKIRFEAKYSF